jgi:hypothetical protein
MATNDSTPNPQISDIVKLVNLAEETVLVAKFQQQVPEGTKIKSIEVILDTFSNLVCGVQLGL